MRERFWHDAALAFLLEAIVADRCGRAQAFFGISGLEQPALRRL